MAGAKHEHVRGTMGHASLKEKNSSAAAITSTTKINNDYSRSDGQNTISNIVYLF